MDAETIKKVLDALIGEIEPVADSAIDYRRMNNLKKAIAVVDESLRDIISVSYHRKSQFGSSAEVGEKAYRALTVWKNVLEECTKDKANG